MTKPKCLTIQSCIHENDWLWTPEPDSPAGLRRGFDKMPTIAEVLSAGGFQKPRFDVESFRRGHALTMEGKIHWEGSEHCGVVGNWERRRDTVRRILPGDQFDSYLREDLCSVCLEDFNEA